MDVERNIVGLSLNHCCHGNLTTISIFIFELHVDVRNVTLRNGAKEIKQCFHLLFYRATKYFVLLFNSIDVSKGPDIFVTF
jgi:hypothetical protein